MHTRLFNMLHDSSDHGLGWIFEMLDLLAPRGGMRIEVSDYIDVYFSCFAQKAVNEHRCVSKIRDIDCRSHVPVKCILIEANLHAATAEHVTRSNKYRISDA